MLYQPVLYAEVDVVRLLGAHVAYRAVYQLEAGLYCARADPAHLLLVADALDVLVCAEFEVDAVGIVDSLLGEPGANELGQVAADLIASMRACRRKTRPPRKSRL